MKTYNRLLVCLALAIGGLCAPRAGTASAEEWQRSLEREWLLEAELEAGWAHPGTPGTREDAAGGCDGVINGAYGFHTAAEEGPWWQVDLGEELPLQQVRVWNRSDGEDMARRAARFELCFSADGQSWRTVHARQGGVFYGYRMPDRSPLVVKVDGERARFVRVRLPGRTFLHLDEVEVIRAGRWENVALNRPADQSSVSEWSVAHRVAREVDWRQATRRVIEGEKGGGAFAALAEELERWPAGRSAQPLYLRARALRRQEALADPLLDFDAILFAKRVPGSFNHMSDQYFGWWSRPGGGLYVLRGFKSGEPRVECLTDGLFREPGSFLRPALAYAADRVLFAWCRHYPGLARERNKLDKANVPEDAFYHVYEMKLDGSGLRRLTRGKYDNFDARYLPDGRIVFLSTRRGQAVQVGRASAAASVARMDQADCYVRCGGGAERPCAVYTLHTMDRDGGDVTAISPFEMFEWEPSVANDGRVLYARWDYVDRDNMPYMSLWSINPDGTNVRLVYGNYTRAPHCTFEPRAVPGSGRIVFTASGHHAQTMGSLVLLDPARGTEGENPIERLTPETPFPEIEGWPRAYYANPWPLSERTMLVAWGVETDVSEGRSRVANGLGLYLFRAGRGLEPLYRDPEISSVSPIPLKRQERPPVLASQVDWEGPAEGRFLVADVTRGLRTVGAGQIAALRVVAIPAKTQPWMNEPRLGLTRDDPGKAVLGTVPVEADGSAYFRVPAGVALFFQALDAEGRAVQTMRSATHVQPGQTLSCTGCHERREQTPPPATLPLAARREPSRIAVGPDGSWTMRFDRLIQPVLDAHCVRCHRRGAEDALAAKLDLTAAYAYDALTRSGSPSLEELVLGAYREGISREGETPSRRSALLRRLADPAGHHGVRLDRQNLERFYTWVDTYAQRAGTFSPEQEQELERLRRVWAALLIEPGPLRVVARPDEP